MRTFEKSHSASQNLQLVIPAGSHTYSKASNQWPQRSPRVLSYGKGAWVWDLDGNRYIDWFPGLTTVSLGHAHPYVTERVHAQLERGTNFQLPIMLEYEAAQAFLQHIAHGADMVKFAKDGSTVNDAALRLARGYTGRRYVAKCNQPFFSTNDWFIGKTRCRDGILPEAAQSILEFQYNDLESLECLVLAHPNDIAAIIMEPVRFHEPYPDFLTKVRQFCDREGIVLIFDEIVTGMKYHRNGAQALFEVQPDLSTWGKGIANGFPVSALTGTQEIMQRGDTTRPKGNVFLLSTTHGAEGCGLAALLATIDVFTSQDVIGRNYAHGKRLREGIEVILAEFHVSPFIQLVGYDCFIGIICRDAQGDESRAFRTLLFQELIQNGILFRGIFYPTIAHGEEEVEVTLQAFRQAATIYCRALQDGVEKHLIGPAIEPVL